MNEESIIVTRVKDLRKILREELQATMNSKPQVEVQERLTRLQAAKFLGVSYQTMHNYTKEGIIKEYGTKGKKFFFKDELMEVIKNGK